MFFLNDLLSCDFKNKYIIYIGLIFVEIGILTISHLRIVLLCHPPWQGVILVITIPSSVRLTVCHGLTYCYIEWRQQAFIFGIIQSKKVCFYLYIIAVSQLLRHSRVSSPEKVKLFYSGLIKFIWCIRRS